MLSRLLSVARPRALLLSPRTARQLHSSIVWHAKSLRPFLLADIGEGITECEVLKWSVEPNSTVSMFDPLCEVQSDKASVEITSPFDGTVKELLVQEGEIAKVGQRLCILEVEDTAEVKASSSIGEPVGTSSDAPANEEEAPAPSTSSRVEPQSSTPEPPAPRARRPHPLDPSAPRSTSAPPSPPRRPSSPSLSSFSPAPDSLAAPSVRHFARQNSIEDLSALMPGSGKNGRIERSDVVSFLEKGKAQKQGSSSGTPPSPSSVSLEPQELEMGRTRLAMFKAMTKSLEIPHFGYSTTLDLTALDALLPTLNAHIPQTFNSLPASQKPPLISPNAIFPSASVPEPASTDPTKQYTRLTVLPLLIKALSRAMMEWPVFRTSLAPSPAPSPSSSSSSSSPKPSLLLRPSADISIALSTPTGLYSPTIQSVQSLSAYEIMGELRRLQTLGRQVPSGLSMKEMPRTGGTVSVSNVGAVGKGEFAHPVLVPGGGVAIVAIGRAKWVHRELESEPGVLQRRLEVGVSWSADHRVVEGAEMAAFVETWRSWVEQPGRMIADGR